MAALIQNMRINHCRFQIIMSQKSLNGSNIGAALQ